MEVQIRPTALFASDGISEHAFPRFLGGVSFFLLQERSPQKEEDRRRGRGFQLDCQLRVVVPLFGGTLQTESRHTVPQAGSSREWGCAHVGSADGQGQEETDMEEEAIARGELKQAADVRKGQPEGGHHKTTSNHFLNFSTNLPSPLKKSLHHVSPRVPITCIRNTW